MVLKPENIFRPKEKSMNEPELQLVSVQLSPVEGRALPAEERRSAVLIRSILAKLDYILAEITKRTSP